MGHIVGTTDLQLRLEKNKEEEGINRVVRDIENARVRNDFSSTPLGKALIRLGFDLYVDKLNEYKHTQLRTHDKKLQQLLLLIEDDMSKVATCTMPIIISGCATNANLSVMARSIAYVLKDTFLFNKLKEDNPRLHNYLGEKYKRANRFEKQRLVKKHIEGMYSFGDDYEDSATLLRLGAMLIDICVKSGANLIEITSTPRSVFNTGRKGRVNIVTLTEEAYTIISSMDLTSLAQQTTNKLPMVVPPRDWTSVTSGGFLRQNGNTLYTVKQKSVRDHLKRCDLSLVYPVINKLQKVPWRINEEMLDLINDIFYGNMIDPLSPKVAPMLYGGLPTCTRYTEDDLVKQEDYPDWHTYNRVREDCKIRLSAEFSNRLNLLLTLGVASEMRDYEKLWFVYALDYRGRVYSRVNFLNPQGQHYVKAMLEFGEGKLLDAAGVFWLKVHIANVYGKDKEPYEDRVRWTEENKELLLNIATNPLDYLSDWAYCDSPFEFVAACKAFKDMWEDKPVHLPIQLDATCSGIQMYSGLLRDSQGAKAVNVIGDTREDIYQMVADKVNSMLTNNEYPPMLEYVDSEGNNKTAYTRSVGKSMAGNITRSIVKRNVMTVPYSVTRKGMSNQLWDKIDEAELLSKQFWEGDKWVANKILTELNHRAIYEVIDGAKAGQEYLVAVSNTLDEPAMWVSPIYKFPVKQTALESVLTRIQTPLGTLSLPREGFKLNKRRQRNSIAPNFIHSIDSTILMYVIDHMSNDIGVIHDCFLVHPNDGYEVQNLYKEGFIEVMKSDPLRQIQEQLDQEGQIEFPEYGDLNLDDVYNSKYIIS